MKDMSQVKGKKTLEERCKRVENGLAVENTQLAKLLLQSLKCNDQPNAEIVLCIKESDIRKAVERLSHTVVEELVGELCKSLQTNSIPYNQGTLWLNQLLKIHAAHLMSRPDIKQILHPMTKLIEERMDLDRSLTAVQGIINFLLNHMRQNKESSSRNEDVLILNGEDSSDDQIEDFPTNESSREEVSDDEMSSSSQHLSVT